MRIILKYIARVTIVAYMALVASCAADNADFAQPDNFINSEDSVTSDSNNGDGYISIADIIVAINTDSETIATTKASSYDEASDEYLIFIQDEDTGEEFYRNTYATTKALTEPLTLPVGNYVLWATSIEEVPATDWDNPQYASMNRSFSIGAEKTTDIEDEVVCTMSNIKTAVTISADLKALFKSSDELEDGEIPIEVTLGLGDVALTYSETETRNGYFAVQPENNVIIVTLSGMYNTAAEGEEASYEPIEWVQTVSDVTSGQARDVQVEILHYNEGVMDIEFTVTSWVYDDVLGIKMSQSFYTSYEAELYDPDSDASDPYSPVVALNGDESSLDYYIYPAAFDDTTLSYSPSYTAVITPQLGSTVSSAMVMLSSDNETAMAEIEALGYDSTTSIWSDDSANSQLESLVTMSSDSSTGAVTATLTYDAMKLFEANRGTHTIKLIVSDSESRRSVTNLNIHSVASDVLDIIWDGFSFDEIYEISPTEELPVVFVVTSKTGLTKMTISITSVVLTPEELGKMNLAQEMDLINPASDAMIASLETLGFPVGDAILNATELTFDITDFMPILAALSDEGSKDASTFVITVGDDSGDCVKTLQVVRK